jgi:hypothetical protein
MRGKKNMETTNTVETTPVVEVKKAKKVKKVATKKVAKKKVVTKKVTKKLPKKVDGIKLYKETVTKTKLTKADRELMRKIEQELAHAGFLGDAYRTDRKVLIYIF